MLVYTVDDVGFKMDREGRVYWSDDWAKLVEMAYNHPSFEVKQHGGATYGHIEIIYRGPR